MIIASLPVFSSKWLADMDFSKVSTKFPIASGPYKVKKLDLGKSIRFEKRDDYWGISHPTRANQFNFRLKYLSNFSKTEWGFYEKKFGCVFGFFGVLF